MARVLAYLGRQTTEVRVGGVSVVSHKTRSLGRTALRLASLPVALVVVLLIRAVRPIVIVRIGRLPASRIGHYVFDTELYLCLLPGQDRGEMIKKRRAISEEEREAMLRYSREYFDSDSDYGYGGTATTDASNR